MPYFALPRRPQPKECMVISNDNILQADYEVVGSWRGYDGASDQGNHHKTKVIVPDQFKDDLSTLCDYSGITELNSGMTIKMSLQEALGVMPRKRKRVDSYKPLIQFLNDEMDVTLIINSQKTKQYGE
ncbi:MAG: hypothetical protein HDR38_05815 [Treponema sp.]|nr:hypothetical protein [Treponema sp.]